MQLSPYNLKDTNQMSWEEFGEIINKLTNDIQDFLRSHKFTFNAIAPILRTGAIPGMVIANKLKITTILPIQLKYISGYSKPQLLMPFFKPLITKLGKKPKILVTECNTVTGESARFAADIILKEYPLSEIYYATIGKVYKTLGTSLPRYRHCFTGVLTNECFEADDEAMKKLDLRPGITIYPWETADYELDEINQALINKP